MNRSLRAFCLCLLLFLAGPLHAQSYSEALTLKQAGAFSEAEEAFRALLRREPGNVEYLFQLGLVQRFQGHPDAAQATQEIALARQPDNADVLLELARISLQQGAMEQAATYTARVLELAPDYVDAQELQQQISQRRSGGGADDSKWFLVAGAEHSSVSRLYKADWEARFLELGHQISPDTLVLLRLEHETRSGLGNTYVEASLTQRLSPGVTLSFALGGSENASFKPVRRMRLSATVAPPDKAISFSAQIQHSRYRTGPATTTAELGVRHPLSQSLDVQFDVKVNRAAGYTSTYGGGATLFWTPQNYPDMTVSLGLSNASEWENGALYRSRTASIGASFQLNNDVTLYLSLLDEDRHDSYRRRAISAAFKWRF